MRKAGSRAWVLLAALLFPLNAFAQPSPVASDQPELRKWDLGGSFGFKFSESEGPVIHGPRRPGRGDSTLPGSRYVFNVDVGRYWTAHLKTDVALTQTLGRSLFVSQEGLPQGGYRYTNDTTHPTGLTGAATYQFFDNVVVHPYVSGGVRLAWVSVSRDTYSSSFQLLATDNLSSSLLARPFVAGGFKSYFHDGRTFMRLELLMAVDPHGSSHVMLRIGAGIDF